jgi:hypothetical protein
LKCERSAASDKFHKQLASSAMALRTSQPDAKTLRSSKPRSEAKPANEYHRTDPAHADTFPDHEEDKTHQCYIAVHNLTEPTGKFYADQTGRFPCPSASGNNYVMVGGVPLRLQRHLIGADSQPQGSHSCGSTHIVAQPPHQRRITSALHHA